MPEMVKKNNSKTIEVKYEELEQYDNWDDDLMTKKEARYAYHIGTFLIWFSSLEHGLDLALANLINERSDDEGYLIIKDLEMSEKIELFYNLTFPRISSGVKRQKQKLNQLTSIRKQLEGLNTLRNKIAHAKWNTLDKDGYVRVDTKTKKEDGFIKFRKMRITLVVMRQAIAKMAILTERISNFIEKVFG